MIERVTVTKADTGYIVESATTRDVRVKVFPSLKGVTAEMYRMFEGKEKLNKDQLSLLTSKKTK